MNSPEPTKQEKILKRVLTISWLDGWSLVFVSTFSLLLTLIFVNLLGIIISAVILAAGIMELKGRRKLKNRNSEGMRLIVKSQLLILTVILVYCAESLGSFDADYVKGLIPEMRQYGLLLGINLDQILQQFELTPDQLAPLAHTAFFILYGAVALATLIYQGGMALYYQSRIQPVTEALATPPRPRVSHLPPSA